MNLAEFRAALRLDLSDPAGASQRFSDADLDRTVTRAVADLTLAAPRVAETQVVLGASSRSIALSGGTFAGLLDVEGVEYPVDAYPQVWLPFRLAPDLASVYVFSRSVLGSGTSARVRWTSAHAVAEASTTVPVAWDNKVLLGAYGYACLAYSTPAADNFKYEDGAVVAGVDDSMIPGEWRARFRLALDEWGRFLGELERRRALGVLGGARAVWSQPEAAPLWPRGASAIGTEP